MSVTLFTFSLSLSILDLDVQIRKILQGMREIKECRSLGGWMESGVYDILLNKIVNKVFYLIPVLGDKPTPVHNVVAPVVVIGSLVVGLLLTLIIYRWKCKSE